MTGGLRPASIVMSPARAGAAVPNAMSFSRAAMREMVRGRWRIEKLKFDLDNEGRGEILYRLVAGDWVFHFFLVSTKLPEELKTDRNFAQSWDAMGVLCQGEWTAAREAYLRREVPKQRAGYADYDTLIYARGNRSGRLFEHVVESLAAGRQPDARLIAPVGYILRTTAFIGNGQLGTRPFAGYEPDHPLRRPYHAQFCSAFMLREYVFDLVDHLARSRNPNAQRLAPEYRRYLGLGNAAATGLVAYVTNHPHWMHQWCLMYERTLAQAKHCPLTPRDRVSRRFGELLDKALQYFMESARPSDGVFAAEDALVADLAKLRATFDEFQRSGTIDGRTITTPWVALTEWAEQNVHPEALEVFNSIVIELHPDLVDAAADSFQADEHFELQPEMTVAALRALLRAQYDWALAPEYHEDPPSYFWYRTTNAPRDVRRGFRGLAGEFEAETPLDTVQQTQRLWSCLEVADATTPIADIVCARPDLRHIVARVQSLAGLDYAELRANWASSTFSPFAPIRFALSFFGLEKFVAVPPKSVRGTFMQGAPIAEDVERGIDGNWPFPLMPSVQTTREQNVAPTLTLYTMDGDPHAVANESSSLVIAPRELARMAQTALQGHGAALGVAEAASDLVMFAQACGRSAVASLLQHCSDGLVAHGTGTRVTYRGETHSIFDARGGSALIAAPAALDVACVQAHASDDGIGATLVVNAIGASLLGELAMRCAERGAVGVMMWHEDTPDASSGFAAAGPGNDGPWYVEASLPAAVALHAALRADAGAVRAMLEKARSAAGLRETLATVDSGASVGNSFLIVCIKPHAANASTSIFEALAGSRTAASDHLWSSADLRRQRDAWLRRGVVLSKSEFDGLTQAGTALLVPAAEEHRVLWAGMDPLKVF